VSHDRQRAVSSPQFADKQRLEAQPAAELAPRVEAVPAAVARECARRDRIAEDDDFIDAFGKRPNLRDRGGKDRVRGIDLLRDEDNSFQICLRLLRRAGLPTVDLDMKKNSYEHLLIDRLGIRYRRKGRSLAAD
jgi:hypothetical protein